MSAQKKYVRRLLWAYFLLVIFEGALRKWVVPQLATPLLVIRDPICLAALLLGYRYLVRNQWVWGFVLVGVLAIPVAIGFGHGNPIVAVFGARILILHFPMLFLFPAVFDREDVWDFAKVTLLIAIPMTVLLAIQFYMPSSHFVNVGVGGEGTSVFSGAAGRNRSSGTFSFTNGLSCFYSFAGALFVGWLVCGPRPLPKWMWAVGGCLVVALPLAISRAIAFQYMITGLFAAVATGMSPRLLRNVVPAALGLALVIGAASQTDAFQNGMEAFSERWTNASRSESGGNGVAGVIGERLINYGIVDAARAVDHVPVTGLGIGMGTNVGAKLLTGKTGFLIAEGSIGATLGELGPVLGIVLIGCRGLLALSMGLRSMYVAKRGNPLPFIIGSVATHTMLLAHAGQPTALGFLVVVCGLMLASMKAPSKSRRRSSSKTAPRLRRRTIPRGRLVRRKAPRNRPSDRVVA